ncbi:TPA: ribonuclease BN, partial [Pseudomonas aeruginosa]|nr:ribonuclease BN [Pseudomonas aeruginosa]
MFRTAYREIGLFGLVKRTVNEFLEDDMPTYASALAYQMLFSLFPFLLVLITLVGYLHLP